ncbi:MAG TPA: hypothetical protein VE403_08070 [Sphingomicrobium sp.]|nr:hypothetical protein [Sphingomicrobium sp.]
MREAFSNLWQAIATLIGAAVFVVLIWWIARAHSRMWRLVLASYAGRGTSAPIATRRMDTIIIAARGSTGPLYTGNIAYRSYPGVNVTVHENGLALSPIPPFKIMCPSIHLPFDEMDLERTDWAFWPEPFAIRMKRLPEIDIILARDTVQWLRGRADRPPFA